MTTIIKDNAKNAAIITQDDLVLLESSRAYQDETAAKCKKLLQKTEEECQLLLATTRQECETRRQELEDKMEQELLSLSQTLKQENYDLLKEFIQGIEKGIFEVCYKVLSKLHFDKITPDQISNLVKNELLSLISNQKLTLKANADNLALLKEQLSEYAYRINFIEDPKLAATQCQLTDDISTIYVDLQSCKDEIGKLLANGEG